MVVSDQQFEASSEQYWRLVFTLCREVLGNEDDAADAAQEVFVRKWRARDTYEASRATFKTWLCSNTHHLLIDRLRGRKSQPALVSCLPDSLPEERAGETPHEALTHALVQACLSQLEPTERQLLLLREVEERTWEELAELSKLTVSQVRTRTERARSKLRECLEKNGMKKLT